MNVLDGGLVPARDEPEGGAAAFVDHRREVLERRSRYRLEKIATRLEVLEGYLAVYLNLDKVIKIIRTEDEPKPKLMKAFSLTDNQAEAILNMRLRSLRKLEEMEIRGEHAALTKEQKDLKKLLGSDKLEIREADRRDQGDRREVRPQDQARQTPHRIRRRRDVAKLSALAEAKRWNGERGRARADHGRLFGKGWLRALKGHQEANDAIKYREGDRAALLDSCPDHRQADDVRHRWPLLHAGLRKLPGGRGNGEAIRTFIDLPPEADIVADVRAMCRAASCCSPPRPAMASSPTKTTPSR